MSLNSQAVCTGKVFSNWNINQQKKLDACRNNIFQSSSVNILFLQKFQIHQPTTVTTLLTRTWRPQHSTKHPQTEGTPPCLFLLLAQHQPYQRQMEMGMGGAVNGITNSISTINDDLSIYGFMLVKRTGQKASVLLVNHACEDLSKIDWTRITQYHTV